VGRYPVHQLGIDKHPYSKQSEQAHSFIVFVLYCLCDFVDFN